jgi:FAD/FMN-containing dehydrogenase
VTQLELLRSTGERLICSRTQNAELFRATVGGLGLTGLITWVEVRLRPIAGPWIDVETIRFRSLDEFFEINDASERDFEYTVAWIDALDPRSRGLYLRGNHSTRGREGTTAQEPGFRLSVPFDCPEWMLNRLTLRAFNALYYRRSVAKRVTSTVLFRPFFYPLDAIGNWNRLYGRRGFFQYQCVVPRADGARSMRTILETVAASGVRVGLAVLKTFGDYPPEGCLSFPRAGVTVALDFQNRGAETLALLDRLDGLVLDAGGAVYPGKDGRMSARTFNASFPSLSAFTPHVDPRFSSSFWRRVGQ